MDTSQILNPRIHSGNFLECFLIKYLSSTHKVRAAHRRERPLQELPLSWGFKTCRRKLAGRALGRGQKPALGTPKRVDWAPSLAQQGSGHPVCARGKAPGLKLAKRVRPLALQLLVGPSGSDSIEVLGYFICKTEMLLAHPAAQDYRGLRTISGRQAGKECDPGEDYTAQLCPRSPPLLASIILVLSSRLQNQLPLTLGPRSGQLGVRRNATQFNSPGVTGMLKKKSRGWGAGSSHRGAAEMDLTTSMRAQVPSLDSLSGLKDPALPRAVV